MEDRLSIKNIKVLNEVAFIHSDRLYRMGEIIDKECVTSLKYLNKIYSAGPADIYDALIETFATVKQYHSTISSRAFTPAIYDCYVIWARMYVIGYFTMHEDEFWRNVILPKMYDIIPQSSIKGEMATAVKYIDKYYKDKQQWMVDCVAAGAPSPDDFAVYIENEQLKKRVAELEEKLKNCKGTTLNADIIKEKDDKIADLEQQIIDKDAEIAELKKPKALRISFVETNGKEEKNIRWAYDDIFKAIGSPASMADCLCNLQTLGMLRGQQRLGKIKNIKGLFTEMQEAYGFTWTYDALAHAIKKRKSSSVH